WGTNAGPSPSTTTRWHLRCRERHRGRPFLEVCPTERRPTIYGAEVSTAPVAGTAPPRSVSRCRVGGTPHSCSPDHLVRPGSRWSRRRPHSAVSAAGDDSFRRGLLWSGD